MHRPRYYRNPSLYLTRGDSNAVRFGFNSVSQTARSTYRRASATPFSPSHNRFVDRSKYVWTANKQTQPTQITQPTPQSQPAQVKPDSQPVIPSQQSKLIILKKSNSSVQELEPLIVSITDSPEAVATDMAAKLKEEKTYLIKKVVEVLGVKKAIRLYYDTRLKEANGGILVQNGIRRRTPGGVFLTLLREVNYISRMEVNRIFQEIKRHELKIKLTNIHDTSQ